MSWQRLRRSDWRTKRRAGPGRDRTNIAKPAQGRSGSGNASLEDLHGGRPSATQRTRVDCDPCLRSLGVLIAGFLRFRMVPPVQQRSARPDSSRDPHQINQLARGVMRVWITVGDHRIRRSMISQCLAQRNGEIDLRNPSPDNPIPDHYLQDSVE